MLASLNDASAPGLCSGSKIAQRIPREKFEGCVRMVAGNVFHDRRALWYENVERD
jgi:hypothetical protein